MDEQWVARKSIGFLELLEKSAVLINGMDQPDPQAEIFYDIMSDGLVWRDEPPNDSDAIGALRALWSYRTDLLLNEPVSRWGAVWQRALVVCPQWKGFHPSRCTPTPELQERARYERAGGARTLRKCERLDSLGDRALGGAARRKPAP